MARTRTRAYPPDMRPRRDRTPTLAIALGGAFLAHVVVLVADDARGRDRGASAASSAARYTTPPTPDTAELPTEIALVSLDAIDLAALPLVVVPGPGDAAGFDATSPMPRASADLPGDAAADRGGGDDGGWATWTGRRDRDQTALRAQLWSDPDRYRAPRQDLDRRAATTEAIARQPERTYGDRQVRARAKAGDAVASRGDRAEGVGAGDGIATADGARAAAAGKSAPARADGATQVSPEAAMVDEGEAATDVTRHGAVSDDVAVAAASDQRDPDPYDLTPSRSGGTDEGVRGESTRDGALADGRGHSTGASRSAAATGKAASSIMASRTDPYLRELMRKLDDEIVFPRDLKLDLRSGRVIVTLALAADGKTSDLTVTLSSGYDGFDRELVRAIKAVGKLGKVPDRLLDGKRSLKLMVPYTFKNPMIR